MRGQILWITAVILCGLAVGIEWGISGPRQLGKVVSDDVAATQRGGQTCICETFSCAFRVYDFCYDATGDDPACEMQKVYYQNPTGSKLTVECCVYCGSTPTTCIKFGNKIQAICIGTTTTVPPPPSQSVQ